MIDKIKLNMPLELLAGGDEVTDIRQNPQFKATHRSKLGQFLKLLWTTIRRLIQRW